MHRATRPRTRVQSNFARLAVGVALLTISVGVTLGIAQAQDGAKANAQALAQTPLVALRAQPAGVPFPTITWPRGPAPAGADAVIKAQFDKAFGGQVKEIGETRAVIIVHNGRIVAERYGAGFDEKSKLISWSMAKSVTAAIVGIAMADGKMKLDDPLNEPMWDDNDPRRNITIRQALHMSDGLRWREDGYDDPVQNDAAKMLFGPGRENIVEYVADKPQEFPQGEKWRYSSGTTNLVSAAVGRAIAPRSLRDPNGKEGLRNFMYDRLFRPIGMNSTAAEFDLAGNFYASSLLQATAQDFARFGLLHLRDGVWDGKRILPAGFVDFVRTPTTAQGATHYGAHWWLSPVNKSGVLKDGPYDSFEAQGFQGQLIAVIPSKDLVIVRLGLMSDEGGWDTLGAWLQPIVNAFPARSANP